MSELWQCLILLGVLEVFWFYATLIIFVDNNNNNNNNNNSRNMQTLCRKKFHRESTYFTVVLRLIWIVDDLYQPRRMIVNVFCHVFQRPYECRTRQCNGRQATTITQAPRALHNITPAFHHHFLSPRDFSTLIAPFQSPPSSQHRFYCYIVMHGAPILKTPRVNVQ